MKKLIVSLMLMIGAAVGLAACGLTEKCPGQQDCGNGCAPTGASCCPDGSHYCDTPYTCGADNMCHGSGGGGGGSSCGCGVNCNSNGICCARGWYGCGNMCYATYNDMLHAGCTSVRTCCP